MLSERELEQYCLSKKGTEKTYPFGPDTVVIKVLGKMFALWGAGDSPLSVNLKCDPDWSHLLREHYAAVTPGYHMNKKHWNTVLCDGSIPQDELVEMVDHSYNLVVKKMRKIDREQLAAM
ncbi:MAG: MmcQ/YjbR family DNA-binding protein [Candidatus Promineifilaceae bacterium]